MARKPTLPGFQDVSVEEKKFKPRAGDLGYAYSLGGFEELGTPETMHGPVQPSIPEDLLKELGSVDATRPMTTTPQTIDPKDWEKLRFITNPASYFTLDSLGKEMSKLHETQQTASGLASRYLSSSQPITLPGVSQLSDSLFKGTEVNELANKYEAEGLSTFEASRRAWDETDMLSTNVHLAWTFDWNKGDFIKGEVPLWGDKTFGSVDLGTKGFMEEIIMDPLNVLGVGLVAKPLEKTLLKGGGSIVDGTFRPSVIISTQGAVPDNLAGRTVTIGGGSPEYAGTKLLAPPTNNPFGIPTVKVNLTQSEKVNNFIADHTPLPFVRKDGLPEGILRARTEMKTTAESLSASMSSEFDTKMRRLFDISDNGTIDALANIDETLPGSPTLADVAARLPRFYDNLTKEQRSFLLDMRERLAPIELQQAELGLDIPKRGDILPSPANPAAEGFYLPRGNALTDGADQVSRSGKPIIRTKGTRGSYKMPAVFDSMAEGISKGYEYISFKDSMRSYIQASGSNSADQWTKNVLKTLTDEDGNPLGTTALMRLEKSPYYKEYKSLSNAIRSKIQTVRNRNVRFQERSKISDRAMRDAERELIKEQKAIEKVRGQTTDAAVPAMKRVEAAEKKILEAGGYTRQDIVEARRYMQQTVSDGRTLVRNIRMNLENLKTAKMKFRKQDRALQKSVNKLENLIQESDTLAGAFNDDVFQELPVAVGKKYQTVMNRRNYLEEQIEKMTTRHEMLEDHIGKLMDREDLLRGMDKITVANNRESVRTLRKMHKADVSQTRLKTEFRMLEREVARSMKMSERFEKKQINNIKKSADAATKRAVKLDDRTADALLRVHQSQDELIALKDRFASVKNEYDHAKRLAEKHQSGELPIGLRGLEGYSFPEEFAAVMNKNLKKESPPEGKYSNVINTVNAYANFYRSIRATGDDSAVSIHGLLGAFANPKATAKTFTEHWKAWGTNGEVLLGKYVDDFNHRAMGGGRLTSEDWSRELLRIGGEQTEFFISGAGGKIQKAPFVKQANRAFGFYGDKLRLEWADDLLQEQLRNGKTIEELRASGKLKEIAEGVNVATGWAKNKFAGDLGDFLLFAPRFFQARLQNVGKALQASVTDPVGAVEAVPGVGRTMRRSLEGRGVRDIPLDQRIARRSMLRFIGGAATLTYGINYFMGNETDARILVKDKDGNWQYNSNFMRIRFKGTDVSLFGTYDSLARMLVLSGTGQPLDAWRGMASGPVQQAWDFFSGKDYYGSDTTVDWMPGESDTLARLGYIMEQHIPFSFEDVPNLSRELVSGDRGGAAFRLGAEFFGVKNAPLGYKDTIYEVAKEFRENNKKSPSAIGDETGWDHENLSRGELRAIKEHPDMKKLDNDLDIELQGEQLAFDNLSNYLLNAEQGLVNNIESGADLDVIGDQISRLKANRSAFFDAFQNNPNNADFLADRENLDIRNVADYYGHMYYNVSLYIDPETGFQDWDSFEEDREAVLEKAMQEGGSKLVAYIVDSSGPNANNYRSKQYTDERVRKLVEQYDADQEIIREYYSLPMNIADDFNFGDEFREYLRLSKNKREQFLALADIISSNPAEIKEMKKAKKMKNFLSMVTQIKKGWRAHPDNWMVEAKMWKWGIITSPVNKKVVNMQNQLIGQSREAGKLGYYDLRNIEELIQQQSLSAQPAGVR